MAITIGTAAGQRTVAEIHVGTAAGRRAVSEAWVGTAAGNRKVFSATPPLMATASPETIYWQVVTPGSFYVSADNATVSVIGGAPPYDYAWSIDHGGASIDSAASASTGFQSIDGYSANATCTVTDADGNTADTNPVSLV